MIHGEIHPVGSLDRPPDVDGTHWTRWTCPGCEQPWWIGLPVPLIADGRLTIYGAHALVDLLSALSVCADCRDPA